MSHISELQNNNDFNGQIKCIKISICIDLAQLSKMNLINECLLGYIIIRFITKMEKFSIYNVEILLTKKM